MQQSPRNWAIAENFSELAAQMRLHAPFHQLALDELLNLEVVNERVNHPTTGDILTGTVALTRGA